MILRFARRTLMLAAAFLSAPVWPAEPRTVGPAWVVDPAQPGDHLPPTGASLFDTLFADGHGGHALPFPFEKLLARLDGRLSRDPTSPLPPAKRVLIPLGRSLQRTAAAPDYFAFPRVVVAVDTAPTPGAPLLKDRLYLGYQEKSAVLEVISYNEAAGRFEFQLVKDYRAGGRPQVFYANRHICFACHQNGAPIFSRALWDETNANPAVAARLAAAGRSFYGIPPERGVDVPYAIDKAVRRANRFALAQRLWREGCGAGEAGVRCRAGLFAAALRLRFADGRAAPSAAAFDAAVARPLRANGARLWPAGLAIGRADLPNRNPLQGMSGWPDEVPARIARSHVAARFEPLLPRPSEEAWRADAPEAVAEAVAGVAEFISDDDRTRLEAALARRAKALPRVARTLDCVPLAGSRASRCRGADGAALDLSAGKVERLSLAGELPQPAFALGARVRLAGGDLLERVDTAALKAGTGPVVLHLRADSLALADAMASVAAGADGSALLGEQPIPRVGLIAALLNALGDPPRKPMSAMLPTPRLETYAVRPAGPPLTEAAPGLGLFHAWCAACHLSAEQFPPNFLVGPEGGLEARIRQCAPRIFVRLAMARRAPAERDKTPMPPESMLPAFHSDTATWAASADRAALEAVVAGLLKAESGRDPDLNALLAGGYEALRPCLAKRVTE